MLTEGDLVRIKQDSFLYPESTEPWSVRRLKTPTYGIVIKKRNHIETEVFVENQVWIVGDKCLQLIIGDQDVHKTKQN